MPRLQQVEGRVHGVHHADESWPAQLRFPLPSLQRGIQEGEVDLVLAAGARPPAAAARPAAAGVADIAEGVAMSEVMYCWPPKWLEAAGKAGLAVNEGNGQWRFFDPAMSYKLEVFGNAIWEAAEAETKRQMERDRE